MRADHRDLVIEELSNRERDLFEANRQLIDLVADLAYESRVFQIYYTRELIARVQNEQTIKRLYQRLGERPRPKVHDEAGVA